MMMKESKKRYSIPARVVELLYTDDSFYNDVMKMKKSSSGSNFPRSDEWRDANGFNISFALAGYSPEDVSITTEESVLIVKGRGMDSISKEDTQSGAESKDAFDPYSKESRPRIHIGSISRGIARRKFCVKNLISDEFDIAEANARMEHGLLHIFIPQKKAARNTVIKIEMEGN
jgi:HSP20 family molecular chaperone IbpA